MNQQAQQNPGQQNALARALILNQSIERVQQIYSGTVDAAQQNVVNVAPRNVGLIKGFFIDVEMSLENNSGGLATLAPNGPANVIQQFKFDDLQNNTRIQTTGWHLHFINTVRNQRPFGLCETLDTSPIGYGNNWDVISAPATIADTVAGTVKMRYYLPLAYSNGDLRGAIYANVVNATMQLQMTINRNAISTTAAIGSTVYTAAAADSAAVGNVTITVYQHYLDQLPMGQGGPILPLLDLQTIYELKNTTVSGLSLNQDYTIPYANFRTFLSTFAMFQNGTQLNVGSDVNYWALRSANFTDIFKLTPVEVSLLTRLQIGLDLPDGAYYFNHRDKPINTIQYGNMELVLNPGTVNANAAVLVGYEDFAMINVVSGAGSLPAGG